ncbi:hypothetical protein RchiOBHm_Chr6g0263591 [Rosa chinensis]|uniref:Uncharacterized protein n=1 Tax=Rosa chinensis TaxID=74649 RepID=A0A2P6PNX9_ROSCH|nr:hypothetical protein RchiOBHm_Chr6g0263591 [Rosa chinensis]
MSATYILVSAAKMGRSVEWERKSNLAYTQKDIDVVRAEWANHVMKF